MAIKGPIGGQLPMFGTGRDVKNMVTGSSDKLQSETMEGMWGRKLEEAALPEGADYLDPYAEEDSGLSPSQAIAKGYYTDHGTGLADSIRTEGWRPGSQPLTIDHYDDKTRLYDGHHRVAALDRFAPDTHVPLRHDSDVSEQMTMSLEERYGYSYARQDDPSDGPDYRPRILGGQWG